MTADILDPSAILGLLPSLLPPAEKSLVSPQDAIAALVHSALTALSFRLVIDQGSPLSTSESNVLPVEWNKNGPAHYSFKYRHEQSSLDFLINVSKLGTRTLLNAIALENDKVATLDISTLDFTSPSFYPHHLDASNQSLVYGFISSNRIADFMSQFKLKIVQKLLPGLQKEGYMEESTATTTTSSSAHLASQDQRNPRPRPLTPPDAPDFNPYPRSALPRNPLEIGRRDLDPFPANPFAPPSMFPNGGDGMFVGSDHPIFGRGRGARGPFADRGPWGGDGFLPPLGAPPGARFDPVGPGPFGGNNGRRPGGRNLREPDNDDFIPPGVNDMFM